MRSNSGHGFPGSFTLAAQDRIAKNNFAMAVGKGWERPRRCEVAAVDVVVNGAEELLERVGKALVVPARVIGERTHGGLQQRGIADQQFIGSITFADPE